MLKTNLFLLGALPIVNLLSATEAQSSLDTRVTRIEEQLAKKTKSSPLFPHLMTFLRKDLISSGVLMKKVLRMLF